jgi:hypothetical protein
MTNPLSAEPPSILLTRMISSPLFPEESKTPIVWVLSGQHPLVPGARIIRMLIDDDGVDVYSALADGKKGMRNLVPMHSIQLIEEAMSIETLAEEIEISESEEPDPEPEPELPELPETSSQTTS